jgi:hypothetical protein
MVALYLLYSKTSNNKYFLKMFQSISSVTHFGTQKLLCSLFKKSQPQTHYTGL